MRWLIASVGVLISLHAFAVTSGPTANANRAYPASCLSYPLQEIPAGPLNAGLVDVPVYDTNNLLIASEQVQIALWRVPCAGNKSALVGELTRAPANYGRSDQAPALPKFLITQGSVTDQQARVAREPNTYMETIASNERILTSLEFVFENYEPGSGTPTIDFTQALSVRIVPAGSLAAVTVNVLAYDSSLYDAAAQPLPITGYLSGAWYDPAHGGEGMLIQIYDNPDQITRTFYAQWFTYDQAGHPFWLVAQGTVNIGDNQVSNALTQYLSGGGFAGSVKATNRQTWGTMGFQYSDCNTLQFTYNGQTDAATNGPAGNGSRTWTRLGNVNGILCN